MYDLRAWRAAASPSYTNQLFEWTRLNGEDKLYNLGSQPPFNLVVRSSLRRPSHLLIYRSSSTLVTTFSGSQC